MLSVGLSGVRGFCALDLFHPQSLRHGEAIAPISVKRKQEAQRVEVTCPNHTLKEPCFWDLKDRGFDLISAFTSVVLNLLCGMVVMPTW